MSIELISKALGDESRKRIIELLKDGELPASSIFDKFEYAAPTISRHLSVLKEAGLVRTRRNGVFIYYTLEHENLQKLTDWLAPFLPPKKEKGKTEPRDRQVREPKKQVENPFDKFQSEF